MKGMKRPVSKVLDVFLLFGPFFRLHSDFALNSEFIISSSSKHARTLAPPVRYISSLPPRDDYALAGFDRIRMSSRWSFFIIY